MCTLKSIGIAEGLSRLSDEDPDANVTWTPAVLSLLQADMKQQGFDVTFDFLQVIHRQAQRYADDTGKRTIDVDQYQSLGGLTGVLRRHVDQQLETLEARRARSVRFRP